MAGPIIVGSTLPAINLLQQVLNNGGYVNAGILLLATTFVIALVYMASKIFQYKKAETWAVNEAFQCLATAGILYFSIGILLMFASLMSVFFISLADQMHATEVSAVFTNAQKACMTNTQGCSEVHILGARAYLLTRLDKLQNMYDWIYYTYAIAGTSGSFQRNFPEKTVKAPFSSFASKISEYVQSTLEYIFYGYLFIYIQLALLDLIKTYFVFAFAGGVVLRAMPFTHSVGSFLIASAVGLYFIYPLFLTLLLLLNYNTTLDLQQSDIIGIAKQENPGLYLNYYIEKTLMHQQFYGTAAAANEQPRSSFSSLLNGIDEIKNIVQFLMLTMILYPLVAFVITYTFIHQIAELMDANVADLGRGLVRIL